PKLLTLLKKRPEQIYYAGFTPTRSDAERGVAYPGAPALGCVFPVAIRSRQAEKIDSTPKRSLHGARQPRHNATLQPPVCSALRFNMGVDGSQRIGAALTPRFGVASASGVNPALSLKHASAFSRARKRKSPSGSLTCLCIPPYDADGCRPLF
ncbi:unnamed protein product, partial [Pleuronectes platessa]